MDRGHIPAVCTRRAAAADNDDDWMDSFTCFAAANIVQSDIVVFKWIHEQWVFLKRFEPSENQSAEPILFFLKNGHFTTLDPLSKMLQHWIDLEPLDVGPAFSFLGGVKNVAKKRMCEAIPSSQKQKKVLLESKDDDWSDWFRPEQPSSSSHSVLISFLKLISTIILTIMQCLLIGLNLKPTTRKSDVNRPRQQVHGQDPSLHSPESLLGSSLRLWLPQDRYLVPKKDGTHCVRMISIPLPMIYQN